ncbi:20501_t:CDS:1 [Gigaspora margarita]|uniref:20501_t:CDS:1 n=1 Tax=Gigaspora margarita TaxID=4874 RepID=A0ABN7UPT9_GIGMA|nr:20501_t:CDS:1 [Gigaspora margarita]
MADLETLDQFFLTFQKKLYKIKNLEKDIRDKITNEIANTRNSFDVKKEYTISSDNLQDDEFKNFHNECKLLISAFKSKSKNKETDFLFKIFYTVFDIFQENGYLKLRKYFNKFIISKKTTSVSFIPDKVTIKNIKTDDDDSVNSQIKLVYNISRKEQTKALDIIINAIEANEYFVNEVLIKSWTTLESYNKSKNYKEIANSIDSNINKIVRLLTLSMHIEVTDSYHKLPKLLIFAQLLFDSGLVLPAEITKESYSKFKKDVNKRLNEWELTIVEMNLKKSGSRPNNWDYAIAIHDATNKVRKRLNLVVDLWLWCKTFGLIILARNPNFGIGFWEKNLNKSNYLKLYNLLYNNSNLKKDLKQQNDKFLSIICQGLQGYANLFKLNDKNLIKRLPIKLFLFEINVELFSKIKSEQEYETTNLEKFNPYRFEDI